MIETWLSYTGNISHNYTFRLIDVSEINTPNDNIENYLAAKILESYRNIDFLKLTFENLSPQKLEDYINEYVIPSNKNRITKNVQQGDFGEVLASLIVSYFHDLEVPIFKLRWKFNKERSLFCTDLIAHNHGEVIDQIHYYEIKTRLTMRKETVNDVSNYVTINAHNSLLYDENSPNEAIADFLSRHYYEMSDFDKHAKYSSLVLNPSQYNRNFELFFIFEKNKFKEDILEALNSLPPSLSPLMVTIVLIDNLGRLILKTRDKIYSEANVAVYGNT